MAETTITVGENIKRVREALGLSQAELAERIGQTPAAVSHWESGRRLPSLENLYEIRTALGCTWAVLLDDE